MNGKCAICGHEIPELIGCKCPVCNDDAAYAVSKGWLKEPLHCALSSYLEDWKQEAHIAEPVYYKQTGNKLIIASKKPGLLIGVGGKRFRKYEYFIKHWSQLEYNNLIEQIEFLDVYEV